jgi:hypothetical protein
MSTFLSIQALLEEGVPKRAIARRLGVDVRTVRKHERRIEQGASGPERAAGPAKLDDFRARIEELVRRGMTAVQIYQELVVVAGFDASYATVRRLVRKLKHTAPEVFCRMRYLPGEEAQVDFGSVGRLERRSAVSSGTASGGRRGSSWSRCAGAGTPTTSWCGTRRSRPSWAPCAAPSSTSGVHRSGSSPTT